MKNILLCILWLASIRSFSQSRINPVIKDYGGIFEIPYAVEKPDPALMYNIVIEVEKESEKPDTISWALNNVAST